MREEEHENIDDEKEYRPTNNASVGHRLLSPGVMEHDLPDEQREHPTGWNRKRDGNAAQREALHLEKYRWAAGHRRLAYVISAAVRVYTATRSIGSDSRTWRLGFRSPLPSGSTVPASTRQ